MEDKQFISGIYNHCDRWCERCDFADRCKVFYEERKQFNALEDKDDFMSIVSQNLENVMEMLQKIAKEKGIDLDNIEDEKAIQNHQKKTKDAGKHPLSVLALDYLDRVQDWLESQKHLEDFKQKHLQHIDMGVNLDKSDKALRQTDEALQIIRWYLFQIHIKLSSAIRYYPHDPEFEDEMQNMHHSSAKIALIGVENSMKAWHILLELVKEEEDFILDILIHLQQLKTQIHKQFPLLYNYKRPFFDS